MRHITVLILVFALTAAFPEVLTAGDSIPAGTAAAVKIKNVPPVVHSETGDSSAGVPGRLHIYNIGKRQQYSGARRDSWDTDIFSPKSATFSPDGKLFYINSLEGGRTVVYDSETLDKKAVIDYKFGASDSAIMAPLSGFYKFTHYPGGERLPFMGKPVESTWSHGGRYLWVPFYRRTFDINAQDPSAIAVVDTRSHSIIRVFETGPLPKMVATSNKGDLIAITHWGDNTVGFIDISSPDPSRWRHLPPVTVGHRLELNFPLDKTVNRDANSGFLLRGTIFTPDDRYLLVSGMAGPLQVIDMESHRHIGSVHSLYGIRHLDISNGRLYGSQNIAATVVSIDLDSLTGAIDHAKTTASRTIGTGGPVRHCKVGKGARTLSASPDGAYLFVACNSASAVYAVDAATMTVADTIRCDSYPVGLALSSDGHRMIVTSQGRDHNGGNAVNIFRIERFDSDSTFLKSRTVAEVRPDNDTSASDGTVTSGAPAADSKGTSFFRALVPGLVIILIALAIFIYRRRK